MRPALVIVDTNVVVSGLLTGDDTSPTALILNAMLDGTLRFVVSDELVAEYLAVLQRPAIAKLHTLTIDEVETLVRRLVLNAGVASTSPSRDDAPDRGDQHLWDLMDAVPDAVLVTGDARLRRSSRRKRTLAPAELTEA